MEIAVNRARHLYRQARIQRLLGRPQRAAELCRAALQTEDYSVAHLGAHHMLAELEFPGEDYFQILARIHEHLKPCTKPSASGRVRRSAAGRSTACPTWRTSPRRGSVGTTRPGLCTASGDVHRQKPKPSTTLNSSPESTPVTRNEVCIKPGCLTFMVNRRGFARQQFLLSCDSADTLSIRPAILTL